MVASGKGDITGVGLFDLGELTDFDFVVIFARFEGKWLFCKHRERVTYEVPGGHVEPGETLDAAARRELYEETGAVEFTIRPMFDYAVYLYLIDEPSNGRVFLAEVSVLGPLPESEIGEVVFIEDAPQLERMTYPTIQPLLYKRIIEMTGA